ncbi:hypothetical protein [Citrobacter braakii]|jgi:hypothetical protein|uniref:hypothetical protein n=1 Tax=Citrobacter braakii TaxID=57706 RepID=UPI0023AEA7F5|nr:hypothetical protein [Citrobacter braakii]
MSEFKGTPGPWRASDHYEDVVTVLDERGFEVVTAEHCLMLQDYAEKLGIEHWADDERAHLQLSDEEQSANAHLIASAPELLEVCIRLRNQLYAAGYESKEKSLNPTEELLHQTEQAINKALGK